MKSESQRENSAGPGAHVDPDGVRYCVWAPAETALRAVMDCPEEGTRALDLSQDERGYWRGFDPHGKAGDLYQFQLTSGRLLPDMASRFQPRGVHGPSECIDPKTYGWRCAKWTRPAWTGQAIYELHVGAFTPEGTFRAAIAKLDHVRSLGVEAIELMPLADFPGERNWGYDGVSLYAPARCYGRPDDLRALVDAAHERGLAVILDVVYNHLGPVGNYLSAYSADYFHPTRTTPWGPTFFLDGPRSVPVRDFLVSNAAYWLDDFRIDGLRLDASHAIVDDSHPHLLAEITTVVHARGGFVIAEDERNHADLMRGPDGHGFQIDAVWSDDFHHQVRVALTGTREAYFKSYDGSTVAMVATLQHGWTYRGQPYAAWADRPRGSDCTHLPANAFVFCIENHDQVGNRAKGERLAQLVDARKFRAASMLLCLSPYTPMIFMGQEWAASSPFLFFTDHDADHGPRVSAGRKREFEQSGLNLGVVDVPDPQAVGTFLESKLRWDERVESEHARTLDLYRDCLHERAQLGITARERDHWQILAIGDVIALHRRTWRGDRLLLVALGSAKISASALPPELSRNWRVLLHSDGVPAGKWDEFEGPCAVWLAPAEEPIDAAH